MKRPGQRFHSLFKKDLVLLLVLMFGKHLAAQTTIPAPGFQPSGWAMPDNLASGDWLPVEGAPLDSTRRYFAER